MNFKKIADASFKYQLDLTKIENGINQYLINA